jgi:hypothetical protein
MFTMSKSAAVRTRRPIPQQSPKAAAKPVNVDVASLEIMRDVQ